MSHSDGSTPESGAPCVIVAAPSYGAWVTFDTQLQVDEAKKCMGEVLKQDGWRRDSYIVSSKVFFGSVEDKKPTQKGLSRKHIVEACDQALKNPHVSTVITGASKASQVESNMKALDVVPKLTDDVMERIERILTPEG